MKNMTLMLLCMTTVVAAHSQSKSNFREVMCEMTDGTTLHGWMKSDIPFATYAVVIYDLPVVGNKVSHNPSEFKRVVTLPWLDARGMTDTVYQDRIDIEVLGYPQPQPRWFYVQYSSPSVTLYSYPVSWPEPAQGFAVRFGNGMMQQVAEVKLSDSKSRIVNIGMKENNSYQVKRTKALMKNVFAAWPGFVARLDSEEFDFARNPRPVIEAWDKIYGRK